MFEFGLQATSVVIMSHYHVSHDVYSLQQLIDYDTEVSQILLKSPIESLKGIDNGSRDPLLIM